MPCPSQSQFPGHMFECVLRIISSNFNNVPVNFYNFILLYSYIKFDYLHVFHFPYLIINLPTSRLIPLSPIVTSTAMTMNEHIMLQ